jgi:ABC-2 type transport system ATP-binding protein
MIRAHDLTKSYGASTAVDAITFEVAEGEIFAFLGPNGAGKTTTVKMLTTLLKPSSGLVEIDGLDPAVQQNEVRKRFGIVFQDSSTDDELTAYENMDFHGVLYKVPKNDERLLCRRLADPKHFSFAHGDPFHGADGGNFYRPGNRNRLAPS